MWMRWVVVRLVALLLAFPILAQESASAAQGDAAVYVVAFRTPAHVRYSKPEVFHGFATDLWDFLKLKGVAVKMDPERGTIETESPMSVDSMLNIARQVGATSLLFVTIDRPMTKWIKVTVQSYDRGGKLLWREEASDAGSMTGSGGYKKTLERLEAGLAKRLGGPGLPVTPEVSPSAKATEEATKP